MVAFCLKSLYVIRDIQYIFPPKHDITSFKSKRENSLENSKKNKNLTTKVMFHRYPILQATNYSYIKTLKSTHIENQARNHELCTNTEACHVISYCQKYYRSQQVKLRKQKGIRPLKDITGWGLCWFTQREKKEHSMRSNLPLIQDKAYVV